jgi:hypothetical protein
MSEFFLPVVMVAVTVRAPGHHCFQNGDLGWGERMPSQTNQNPGHLSRWGFTCPEGLAGLRCGDLQDASAHINGRARG